MPSPPTLRTDELANVLMAAHAAITFWGPAQNSSSFSCMISTVRGQYKWKEPWTLRGRGDTMMDALDDVLAKLTAMEFGRDDLRTNA